jgi:hypothetical protein
MESIDKKGLKKLPCPRCQKPKLRFEHSADGVVPDGGSGPDRDIRCDACRGEFMESDPPIQAAFRELQAERTPAPVSVRHH